MSDSPFSSEDAFLQAVAARFPNEHPHMALGRGDDCAVLRMPEAAALTTDLFIEGVHFRRDYFSTFDAGRKALAVNVSDLAGMGASPLGFSLGLAGPPDTPASWWEGFLDGMAGLAGELGIPLVGGDLNAAPQVTACVTIWGAPGPGGRFLERGRARAEDVLFVVGELGLARAGLQALEEHGPDAALRWPEAVAAHLRPAVRVEEGLLLANMRGVRGAMDVSDGLARDLPRFLGPGLGAKLDVPPDTLHQELVGLAEAAGEDPAEAAVLGGEDYALLAACPRHVFLEVFSHVPGVWPVGEVTPAPGIILNGRAFHRAGFDHFG